jgi:hypothetical protein
LENLKEIGISKGVSVDGRIILKCMLNKTGGFGLFVVVHEGDGWYLFCPWL